MYEQGTGKEMKKWAYEIHSSFLVPGAVSIKYFSYYFMIKLYVNLYYSNVEVKTTK